MCCTCAQVGGHAMDGRWHILILFAGPPERKDGLAAFLRKLGCAVTEIDVRIGGAEHDVLDPVVQQRLLARVQGGEFHAIFAAPPCKSFSVAHRPKLRTVLHPEGLPVIPTEWRQYVNRHNRIAEFTFDILKIVDDNGGIAMVENPAARNGPPHGHAAAKWNKYSDHGALWHTRWARRVPLVQYTMAQCAMGASVQKYTTIAVTRAAAEACKGLEEAQCVHQGKQHDQIAHGRNMDGGSRSEQAAAYPAKMNAFLASALFVACETSTVTGKQHRQQQKQDGGLIANGIELAPTIQAAVNLQRWAPLRFAALKHRVPESMDKLANEALPGNLHRAMIATSSKSKSLKRGREFPTENSAKEFTSAALLAPPKTPSEAIPIEMLFWPGVYQLIEGFYAQVREAAKAIIRGERPPNVETVVLPQEAMPSWARGIIWDCRDRNRCVPMQRSDRFTIFPGARQIDRAAIRQAARDLAWEDKDIINQIGEGGIETRSQCPLTTVLSWHHKGFETNLEAAKKVIMEDMKEEWVSQPYAHPPMIPCRVLPRNVIMQPRTRLRDDGSVEHYDKPRISQDSSDGAQQSVNGGVPNDESGVELPTVQDLGRALAIIDTAGSPKADGDSANESEVRAESYMIDATAAFRFCMMQASEWWTQCFVFWTLDQNQNLKVGICIDMRMGFGGKFSPNRFERISRLIGALVQRRQANFDETHPHPEHVERWIVHRNELQKHGLLPKGSQQCNPRYAQVFIDDFAGVALNDPVSIPEALADVDIAPSTTSAMGGTPSSKYARVRIHAMIAIKVLRWVGMEAAPSKTLCGDPVIALGIRVSRANRRLDIPTGKVMAMTDDISRAQALALAEVPTVDIAAALRITGRASNLSQVSPELLEVIHGGYRVTGSKWSTRSTGMPKGSIRLRKNSVAWQAWTNMLTGTHTAMVNNTGVDLAPARDFGAMADPGSVISTTDASGCDGVGGYVFHRDFPDHVWIVSEKWPPDIQRALDVASMPIVERPAGEGMLPMPAAELFGAIYIPLAVAAQGIAYTRIFAIGDCQPAAIVLHHLRSSNDRMRAIVGGAIKATSQWLAVAIRREFNVDADRLSHPDMINEVIADARGAGLTVHRVDLSQGAWDDLREVIANGPVSANKRGKKQGLEK